LKIDDIENLWIETDELIIGMIYKPPSFPNVQFLEHLENTLHNLYLSKKKCLMMGDINIDTLKKNNTTKQYINLLQSEGFNPLIHEATRVTGNSQTCIVHIHSNFTSSTTSGSIAVEVADHLPVFTIIYDPKHNPFPEKIEIRDFNSFNSKLFKENLANQDWSLVYNSRNANESLDRFLHIFNCISYKYAPVKEISLKSKSYQPWITSGFFYFLKEIDENTHFTNPILYQVH